MTLDPTGSQTCVIDGNTEVLSQLGRREKGLGDRPF